MTALDAFVLEKAPGPLVEVPDALVRARGAFKQTLAALNGIADGDLGYQWMWDGNEQDVRYGFYRAFEILESGTSAATRALAAEPSSEARDAVAAATASRWALHGVLATLSDTDLDADPGNGEWTVRRTMQHVINSQRGYAWGSAAWLAERELTARIGVQRLSDDTFKGFPEEEDEGLGSLSEIRGELDDIVDVTSARFATLSDDDLSVTGRWSGAPVSIAFRQWRWSSHIAEHTIQIEKTLDMLGRRRSEIDWLSRLLGQGFGRLEASAFGRASAAGAETVFEQVARELSALHPQVVAAAHAAVPYVE